MNSYAKLYIYSLFSFLLILSCSNNDNGKLITQNSMPAYQTDIQATNDGEVGIKYQLDLNGQAANWTHVIKYKIDDSSVDPGDLYAGLSLTSAKQAIRDAASKWNDDLGFEVFKEDNSSYDILIKLNSGSGTPHVEGSPSGHFGNMSVRMELYQDYDYAQASNPRFRNTVHHEFAHILGLRHQSSQTDVAICGEEDYVNSIMTQPYHFEISNADRHTLEECLNYAHGFSNSVPVPNAPYIHYTTYYNHPKIYWSSVEYADEYYVYRQIASGSFIKISTTSNTYYVDYDYSTANMGGGKYLISYKVISHNTSGNSGDSNIISVLLYQTDGSLNE